jgi:hypothetical protein
MRLATGLVLWLAAATAATAVGLVAVSAISTDIFGAGQNPLSQSEVSDLLATSTSSSAPPTSTSTSTPEPEGTPTVTEGGTVTARCTTAGLVEILSATPAQGYSVDSDDEIEDHPGVEFHSGHTKIEVRLRCVNGTPQAEVKYED